MTAIGIMGRGVLETFLSLRSTMWFAAQVIIRLFEPRTYNSASRMVFINQFYFTSVQILPLFLFVAVIFGSLVNGMAFQVMKDLGLHDYLGRLLMGFVVTEVAPFMTVLAYCAPLQFRHQCRDRRDEGQPGTQHARYLQYRSDRLSLRTPYPQRDALHGSAEQPLFPGDPCHRAVCFQRGFRHERRCLYRYPAAIRLLAGYRHCPVQVRHVRVFHYADPDPSGLECIAGTDKHTDCGAQRDGQGLSGHCRSSRCCHRSSRFI